MTNAIVPEPSAAPYFGLVMLIVFIILSLLELLALYMHLSGFTAFEIILLVALPLFTYLLALSAAWRTGASITGIMSEIPRLVDLPLFHLKNLTLGVNLLGFVVPVTISLKLLVQKRVPVKLTLLVVAITAVTSFLLTDFDPERGMVIRLFTVAPILAAALSYLLKKIAPAADFRPPLLAYAGATLGIIIGADILHLPGAITHPWDEPVFISIGGGSVLDAVFLAGIMALLADIFFRNREENIAGSFLGLFSGSRSR